MIEKIEVVEKYKKNLTVHTVYRWDNLDIGGTKMRHHLCDIRIFSDQLYADPPWRLWFWFVRTKILQRSGVGNIDHRLDACSTQRGPYFCVFHMKLYLNMKLFSNFLPRNDSMPFIPQNRGPVLTRQLFKSWEYSSLFVYGEMTSISHRLP